MTLHETTIAMKCIMDRKKIEMKFNAACLGATFNDDDDDSEAPEFSDKQEAAVKKAMEERGIKWQN